MNGRVLVAALLPGVLEGCSGQCRDAITEILVDEDVSFVVNAAELEAHLGADGELTEDGCASLCRQEVGPDLDDVRSCERGGPADTDLGKDGAWIHCTCSVWQPVTCIGGRAHASVRPRRGCDWFAAAAHDEAASVKSFHALARELEEHAAPAELVARAREAALDEVRHARMMGRLARERGTVPVAPRFRPVAQRDLLALGVENAVEGCVRETFAAFVAHHQARRASRRLRPVFTRIAEDETRHAQWSWDLDAWIQGALPPDEREVVAAARRASLAGLGPVGPRPRGLGLPAEAVARRMARRFAGAVG